MQVNGLWMSESDELPIIAVMSINSYLKHGHQFVLWSYLPSYKNLPNGCILKDANKIIPQSEAYKDVLDTYAHFSDLWRWKFLYENGGFWTDLDVVCLKDEIPISKDGIHLCKMDAPTDTVMVGTLAFPKGHIVSKTMYELCKKPYEISEFDGGDLLKLKRKNLKKHRTHEDRMHYCPYPATYRMFGAVIMKYNLAQKVLTHDYVYPVKYEQLNMLTAPAFNLKQVITENTFAIHLWHSHFAKVIHLHVKIPSIMKELYDMYYKI